MKPRRTLSQLLDVPTTDPDDARRRKLLNILLTGVATLALMALAAATILEIFGVGLPEGRLLALLAGVALSAGAAVIYAINRYVSGWLASTLLLLLVTLVVSLGDEPDQVADGRSLLLFAIPIIMGSVLLRPYASFIMAGLSSGVIVAIKLFFTVGGDPPNPFAMLAFFMLALVSWLASRSLEQALRDLRILNLELDQRVQDRTRELAESLSQTEAILDSTADGIIVLDNDGQATLANPAIAGLVAHSVEEVVGQDILSLMGEDVHSQDREMIHELLQNKAMEEASVKFAWGQRIIAASVAPVLLESGEEIGTVAVFRDFTKEAEVDRMKSTFVSLASHELRTPLNAILGYAEMLKEGVYGGLSDRQRDATGRILANTQHMLSLANNLLDRAQIEAGTIHLNITTFSPTHLIRDAVAAMEILARNRGLELSGEIAADMPDAITGDQQRVNQVVVNLIGNALKFTHEGGVSVHAYRHDPDHWAFSVTDTGIGIPKDAQERIFEPFRQADESATREYGGAGLGLSIVKQLTELMGGRIKLESEVDKGSTFTVVLPLTPPTVTPDEDETKATSA